MQIPETLSFQATMAPSTTANTVIDAHLHVWEMPSERYPWSPLYTFHPRSPAPVELLVQTMDEHGVSGAILVQPSNYGYDHRYLLDSLARYPGRFGAVGLVPPGAPDAPERISALAAQGVRGVRFYPILDTDPTWLDDGTLDPSLEHAGALGAPACFFIAWNQMPRLENLARRHPAVPVVVDHLGHPQPEEPDSFRPIMRLATLPNTHVKISDLPTVSRQPYPYADLHPFIRELAAAFGPQRLLWASNFPHVLSQCGYHRALNLLDQALPGLTDDELGWLMGGTAAELWSLGGQKP